MAAVTSTRWTQREEGGCLKIFIHEAASYLPLQRTRWIQTTLHAATLHTYSYPEINYEESDDKRSEQRPFCTGDVPVCVHMHIEIYNSRRNSDSSKQLKKTRLQRRGAELKGWSSDSHHRNNNSEKVHECFCQWEKYIRFKTSKLWQRDTVTHIPLSVKNMLHKRQLLSSLFLVQVALIIFPHYRRQAKSCATFKCYGSAGVWLFW